MDINLLNNKKEAVHFINQLMNKFDISVDEIASTAKKEETPKDARKWVNLLLGYVGAALIFGGLALLIGMMWPTLGSAARVIIAYGSGLCAYIIGFVFLKDVRYGHLSFPFHLMSAFLLPFGMFVFLHEYIGGGDIQFASIVVFGILAIQFFAPFFKYKKASLLFFAYLFFNLSIGALLNRMHMPNEIIGIGMGISMIAFAIYCNKTQYKSISIFWHFIGVFSYLVGISHLFYRINITPEVIGIITGLTVMVLGYYHQVKKEIISPLFYLVGSIGLFYSLFDLIENHLYFDISFLFVAISVMVTSVQIKSRTLLTISTIATISFLGYFTEQYFVNVTGWPVALIIFGFFLIGISHYALRLGKQIKTEVE